MFRSQTISRKKKEQFTSYCSVSDAFNFEREGQPLNPVFSHEGQAHRDLRHSPLYEKDASRLKVIGELTEIMAATLSAEEEQVGLESYVYTDFFLCYVAQKVSV